MTGALDGIRVLDCSTGLAGPVAGMLLGDYGADVVKVEPPGGDPARPQRGFPMWNRNKRGAKEVLDGADVLITSTSADVRQHSSLVHLHLPPYLDEAPWAGEHESSALLGALTGLAWRQSSFDDVPVDSIYPHVLYAQGMWGAACAVAALVERESSGLGQRLTVGGVHGVMVTSPGMFAFDPEQPAPARRGAGGAGGSVPFYRTYKCGDGEWLFLAALTPNFYLPAFEALGVADMVDDPRVGGRPGGLLKPDNIPWVIERMASVFRTRPRAEWLDLFDSVGIPAGPVLERDDWLDHPQIEAIGMAVHVDDPDRGQVTMPGLPIVMTRTPGSVRIPAPAAADKTLEWSAAGFRPQTTPESSAPRNGPLDGVTVLDLGAVIAGPYAGSLLCELGAEVVKVEPVGGESFRGPNSSSYNKGQLGLAIDLRADDGKAAFLRLVADADVVIDNYRPGVLKRLGIAYDDLREVNPSIITLSITGFGEGGPLGQKPGFDPVLQAMSGMMSAQGGDDDPVFFTMPVDDVGTAAMSAFAVAAALYERTQSGEGQRMWTSLAGTSCLMQSGELVRYEAAPPALRGGRDFPGPGEGDRYYPVTDGFVRVQGGNASVPAIGGMTRDEAVRMLAAAGIAAAPARVPNELAGDAGMRAAEVLHEVKDDDGKVRYTAGRFAHFERTPRAGVLVSPGLGEHTREVLGGAGFTSDEIDDLVAAGVIAAT